MCHLVVEKIENEKKLTASTNTNKEITNNIIDVIFIPFDVELKHFPKQIMLTIDKTNPGNVIQIPTEKKMISITAIPRDLSDERKTLRN